MWRRAWVNGVDDYNPRYPEPFRLVHNRGTGLLIQGTREWADYRVSADVTPHMVTAAGIGARVQGLRRYYALILCNGDQLTFEVQDTNRPLDGGGVALVCEEGRTATQAVTVRPVG